MNFCIQGGASYSANFIKTDQNYIKEKGLKGFNLLFLCQGNTYSFLDPQGQPQNRAKNSYNNNKKSEKKTHTWHNFYYLYIK